MHMLHALAHCTWCWQVRMHRVACAHMDKPWADGGASDQRSCQTMRLRVPVICSDLDEQYPFVPPKMKFVTKVGAHTQPASQW